MNISDIHWLVEAIMRKSSSFEARYAKVPRFVYPTYRADSMLYITEYLPAYLRASWV